eukprot:6184384-Pleurochrysis_carterae.AAC.1
METADFVEQLDGLLKFKALANALTRHLVGPHGAAKIKGLKKILISDVKSSLKAAGLHEESFGNSMADKIFPWGEMFPKTSAFGDGRLEAAKQCIIEADGMDPSRGWHTFRVIYQELSNETAPNKMKVLLTKALHAEYRPDEPTALHLVFQFWIVAFKSCYSDAPARVRVAVLLHAINQTIYRSSAGRRSSR